MIPRTVIIDVDGEPFRFQMQERQVLSPAQVEELRETVRELRGDPLHHSLEDPVEHDWHELGEAGA